MTPAAATCNEACTRLGQRDRAWPRLHSNARAMAGCNGQAGKGQAGKSVT